MIVTFTAAVRPDYSTAEHVARRLAREELIETVPYVVAPGHEFSPCRYCAESPMPAVFAWSWQREGGLGVGETASCTSWPCARTVLRRAELASCPDAITCGYPILAGHDQGLARAA